MDKNAAAVEIRDVIQFHNGFFTGITTKEEVALAAYRLKSHQLQNSCDDLGSKSFVGDFAHSGSTTSKCWIPTPSKLARPASQA